MPETDRSAVITAGDLVVIQRNPASGSGRGRRLLRELIRDLRDQSFQVRLFRSRNRLDRFVRDERVSHRIRCLVAGGGDGTVASLVNRHPQWPIAVLPLGTENLIARHLRIPRSGRVVAAMIAEGSFRRFDLAQAGNHRFLIMAGAGIDADIVHRLHAARTGNIRHWSYIAPILQSLIRYHRPAICVRDLATGREVTGRHVVVSNFSEYGLNLQLNPDADPADGQLDICIFQGTSRIETLIHLACSLFRAQTGRHVVRFRSPHIALTAAEQADNPRQSGSQTCATAIPLQTDGDPADQLPTEITIHPSAMQLLTPPS